MINNLDFHLPVLINEVISILSPKNSQTFLDCTFGAGGYSKAILDSADCKVIAIDKDASVEKFANQIKMQFPKNFSFYKKNFSQIESLIADLNHPKIDGIVLDIGVSSMQLDEKNRGFSFDSEAKLDMRMDQNSSLSAYEVVNQFSEIELTKIIKELGEEPKAKQIAKKIVRLRQQEEIKTCLELAKIVRSFYHGYFKTDPATKTFQAIRIFVNQELEELKKALSASVKILSQGGKILVITFHSLEDRIVKEFFKSQSGEGESFSRYQPDFLIHKAKPNFQLINKSVITPSENEISNNNRARSAKLRVAIRV
jgi:16S rRNA (cytosine1402-N4)-methyltransferase